MATSTKTNAVRRQSFGAVILIGVQFAFGMFVNLFVSIPDHHPGSQPSNFFSGSTRSVGWALAHGAVPLVIHAVLGLLLAIMVIGVVASAWSLGRRSLVSWVVLGALFTIGAGFNGMSFLDYNKNVSSFIMTVLALAALLCFTVVLFLPSDPTVSSASDSPSATGAPVI